MILAGLFVLSEACSDEVKAYLEDIPDPGQYTSPVSYTHLTLPTN